FDLLLGREPAAPDHVARVAEAAEWPLPQRVVALALDTEPSLPWSRALTGTVDGVGCVLLAADDEVEWHVGRLATEVGGGPIGRGEPVDWRATRGSFEHAAAVLRLAHAGGLTGVVPASDHAADLLLTADPSLAQLLVARRLGPLLAVEDEARRERLTETLAAWLAHPDRPQAIADRLHLHVQSVRYRIGQLRETFGDGLDDPDARFELAVALRLIRIPRRGRDDFIARR
ncbi:MAG TPA: helix-turn-helix domain-containing protein, partial [Solirubrobacteraceae bacterium]|nr:helix-turn-helix domain-containing protein [Solirubrobacteraceae bacterium]